VFRLTECDTFTVTLPVHFYRATLCQCGICCCRVSIRPSVRLSVCPSVTSRCSTKTAQHTITQTTPHDNRVDVSGRAVLSTADGDCYLLITLGVQVCLQRDGRLGVMASRGPLALIGTRSIFQRRLTTRCGVVICCRELLWRRARWTILEIQVCSKDRTEIAK